MKCKDLGIKQCPPCVESTVRYAGMPERLISGWQCLCSDINKFLLKYPNDLYKQKEIIENVLRDERYPTDVLERCLDAILKIKEYERLARLLVLM